MGGPGMVMNTYLNLRTRRRKNKKKSRTDITDIVPQEFMKLLEAFKDLPRLGYRKKQVKIEFTKAFFFLVSQLLNNKNRVTL